MSLGARAFRSGDECAREDASTSVDYLGLEPAPPLPVPLPAPPEPEPVPPLEPGRPGPVLPPAPVPEPVPEPPVVPPFAIPHSSPRPPPCSAIILSQVDDPLRIDDCQLPDLTYANRSSSHVIVTLKNLTLVVPLTPAAHVHEALHVTWVTNTKTHHMPPRTQPPMMDDLSTVHRVPSHGGS